MWDDFKKIVDDSSATIFSTENSLEIYEELGIDTKKGYSSMEITDKISDNIKNLLKVADDSDKILYSKLSRIKNELIYRCGIYNENPLEYLDILDLIDHCREKEKYIPSLSSGNWKKIIVNCKNHLNFSTSFKNNIESLKNTHNREFNRANSVKSLIKMGCEIKFENSDIKIVSGIDKVIFNLDKKISNFGGINLIRALFSLLKEDMYSERFERYFFPRASNYLELEKPQIPYGFLLNLSLKYPYMKNKTKNWQKLFMEIIDLAMTISSGVYDIQYYSVFRYVFQSGGNLTNFVSDVILWDSIFSIPQCKPSFAIEICDNLFSFIEADTFVNVLGFSLKDFIKVADWLLYRVDIKSPAIIKIQKFSLVGGVSNEKVLKILDFMAHDSCANRDYINPDDYTSIDFEQKPLIKTRHREYLLADPSWCAPNFFESLTTPLREFFKKNGKNLDIELGKQLEIFLKNKFIEKGIKFIHGYEIEGVEGEGDFLIESDKAIILIEVKKKVLTRKSKSGLDYEILLDLSNSLLYSQCQAGRTEIALRENGKINVKSNEDEFQTIYLNDRFVERISLTQLEFGAFQDHITIKNFLKSLLSYSYKINNADESTLRKFEEFENKRKVWVEQFEKLIKFDENLDNNLFFQCYFMSLPRIMELINLSSDNNSFYDFLTKNRFFIHGTFDWYYEFDKMMNI